MATITGARKYKNPRTGRTESATVCAPVAKMFQYATNTGKDKYTCSGVVGNRAHLTANTPGDHTWFSKHTTFRKPGGPTLYPKKGWIYAGDWHVPDPGEFEKWLIARLRAGVYTDVIKYININNRHWNRKAVRGGKMFAYSSYSPDAHLHTSIMPGAEYAIIDLFGDYEHWRTSGKNRKPTGAAASKPTGKTATPKPGPPKTMPVQIASMKLPAIKRGAKGREVRLLQAALVAAGHWSAKDAKSVIDGDFGPNTESRLKAFQRSKNIRVTGVVDASTWNRLMPDLPPTVKRGSDGYYASLMQLMLFAWGQNPGTVDGDIGDQSIAALQRFQVARKVKNSVVRGRGDGICGTNCWVAFLTP